MEDDLVEHRTGETSSVAQCTNSANSTFLTYTDDLRYGWEPGASLSFKCARVIVVNQARAFRAGLELGF